MQAMRTVATGGAALTVRGSHERGLRRLEAQRRRARGRTMNRARILTALAVAAAALSGARTAVAGETTRVSVDWQGAQGNAHSSRPSISADGRIVAFISESSNLVPDDSNLSFDVFVHDRATLTTSRVSVDSAGVEGNTESAYPSISVDGRFIAFSSIASNLVAGDTNQTWDVFVHDRVTAVTERVSVDSAGLEGNSVSVDPSISSDGRFVAFRSLASNLVGGDTNRHTDIFVHDRATGTTCRVSVSSEGSQGNAHSMWPAITPDGRFVAFASESWNLVPADTNQTWDVFVHDRAIGTTERVSVGGAGQQANSQSFNPSISMDGRFVAFVSYASNLVAGDSNRSGDVFVRDREAGVTERVSVSSTGLESDALSFTPAISADGRFVAFRSEAARLVAGDTNDRSDVFVHDRSTGTITRASVDSEGAQAVEESSGPSLSANGRFLAFANLASNLVAGDTKGTWDVFVRDRSDLAITAIEPWLGSEEGGDLVYLVASDLAAIGETDVWFGGVRASVSSIDGDRVTVRTPPGSGSVEITLSNTYDAVTVEAAFRYVEPWIAARYGNVNAGAGLREDVLFVNAWSGEALSREMVLPAGQPIVAAVLPPSSRASARFAIYLWARAQTPGVRYVLPRGLGAMVLALPFAGGSPPVVWNNAGYRRALGAPTHDSRPAPSILFRSSGLSAPITLALQGLIEDAGSEIPEGFSVTNAILARIE
jgi:Tol biopolymer transport system component